MSDAEIKVSEQIFSVFDTESTGDNSKREDKPIEIAAVKWNLKNGVIEEPRSWLVNPGISIHPSAIAVHGLTDEDVEDSPFLDDVIGEVHDYVGDLPLVAHNIEFDLNMLPSFKTSSNQKIDTLRFARHVFKIGEPGHKEHELHSHKMQELRYWLNLKIDTMGLSAHRAAADILVTCAVFGKMIERFLADDPNKTVSELVEFVNSPILYDKLNFGKFRGVLIKDAISQEMANSSKNYFTWLYGEINAGKMNLDEDMLYSINYHMKQSGYQPQGFSVSEKMKDWRQAIRKTQ